MEGSVKWSVLAPIMFLICVNDTPEGLSSYVNLFADDAKIIKQIVNDDLDKLYRWSQNWKMEFNGKKWWGRAERDQHGNIRWVMRKLTKSRKKKIWE